MIHVITAINCMLQRSAVKLCGNSAALEPPTSTRQRITRQRIRRSASWHAANGHHTAIRAHGAAIHAPCRADCVGGRLGAGWVGSQAQAWIRRAFAPRVMRASCAGVLPWGLSSSRRPYQRSRTGCPVHAPSLVPRPCDSPEPTLRLARTRPLQPPPPGPRRATPPPRARRPPPAPPARRRGAAPCWQLCPRRRRPPCPGTAASCSSGTPSTSKPPCCHPPTW
jgi:hypothetical protein